MIYHIHRLLKLRTAKLPCRVHHNGFALLLELCA
nr:MAG TPA: RNAseH-like protein [Caudoviricetes sp.]